MEEEAQQVVADAVQFAEESPEPTSDDLYTHVYVDNTGFESRSLGAQSGAARSIGRARRGCRRVSSRAPCRNPGAPECGSATIPPPRVASRDACQSFDRRISVPILTYKDALREAIQEEMRAMSACSSWARISMPTAARTPSPRG